MVEDPLFGRFLQKAVFDEILPTVPLPEQEKTAYAEAVLERFRNPFVRHELLSIALNCVSKWKVRVLPSLLDYLQRSGRLPPALDLLARRTDPLLPRNCDWQAGIVRKARRPRVPHSRRAAYTCVLRESVGRARQRRLERRTGGDGSCRAIALGDRSCRRAGTGRRGERRSGRDLATRSPRGPAAARLSKTKSLDSSGLRWVRK